MLQAMRDGAGAKVIKIALMSFLVMAVAGLVLSDVGGFFRGGGVPANTVAKGGGVSISSVEFDQTVRRALARQNMTPAQAYQSGAIHAILRSEIERQLLTIDAQKLGLRTNDDVVTAQMGKIAQQIAPASGGGRADMLKQILRQQGISEAEFIQSLREETATSVLRTALSSGATIVPAALADDVSIAGGQTRDIQAVTLKNDTVKGFEEPTEENLQNFYESNKLRFAIPETRTITLATLNRGIIEDKINISDDELKKAYDDHIDTFTKPETRRLQQAIFANEDAAKKAAEDVKAGKTLKAASGSSYMGEESYQQTGLLKEIADPAFSAKEKDVIGPVQTALGFHVMTLSAIVPPQAEPFDKVKKSIRDQILESRVMDELLATGNDIDDRLAAGDALEDIVKDMGLTTQKIGPFRQNGNDANGKDMFKDYAADRTEIIEAAFSLNKGEAAPVIETADSRFLAVRADDATPADYKSYESIKGELRTIWIAEQKKVLNQARARDAHKKLQDGAKFADVAKDLGVSVQSFKKVARAEATPKDLGPVAVTRLFQVGKNDYILAEQADGITIAAVTSIDFPPPNKAKEAEMIAAMRNDMNNEIFALYINDLAQGGKVKINEKLLQQMYAQTTPTGF